VLPLAPIVFLRKLLVSQELGVHSLGAHVLGTLGLFDAVGMGLVRVVVCARVLLLWNVENKVKKTRKTVRSNVFKKP